MSQYVYLDSLSFKANMYVNNKACNFRNKVLRPLSINKDLWEVALTEIDWEPFDFVFTKDVYVMSDIVRRGTQVGEFFPEILRIIRRPTVFNHPYYTEISCDLIDTIRIYISGQNNIETDNNSLTSVRCVLHFKRKSV